MLVQSLLQILVELDLVLPLFVLSRFGGVVGVACLSGRARRHSRLTEVLRPRRHRVHVGVLIHEGRLVHVLYGHLVGHVVLWGTLELLARRPRHLAQLRELLLHERHLRHSVHVLAVRK